MRTMVVYRGLPGSGKSTEAAKLVAREPGRFVRINRDDLRGMCVGPGNNPHDRSSGGKEREELVRAYKSEMVRMAMRQGFDVVLDDTHLVSNTVKQLHQLAASIGDVTVVEKACNLGVDECIARDATRTGFARVGEKVIRDMARGARLDKGRTLANKETYYPPRWSPGGPGADPYRVVQDDSLPKAIICDLDGTLSLLNGRNPFDASTCDKDLPNVPVIECVKAMYAQGYKVLFTSGREDQYREPTVRFIEEHVKVLNRDSGFFVNGVQRTMLETIYYQLFMRPTGDQRKDSVVKSELFEQNIAKKYNVVFVLDDRNQVVDNWREMGLSCFQVNPGAF